MAAEGEAGGMTGYIKHHLEHLHVEVGPGGAFWQLHLDSIFFKLLLSILFVVVGLRGARRSSSSGVPGSLQCAIELIVEVVDGLAANGEEGNGAVEAKVMGEVLGLCGRFPVYPKL
mgnify:CR=1 FL=1